MKRKLTMYNGKVWGHTPSPYAKQYGYLDYRTLSHMVGDMVLNNYIFSTMDPEDWELENGCDFHSFDREGNEVEPYSDEEWDREYRDVYQYYIITPRGAEILKDYTDQIVYYNDKLDLYLWGITHFGTSWDYVLTDIKLEEGSLD